MRVLIVGSGGREAALDWKLRHEGHETFMAPGNGGSKLRLEHSVTDFENLSSFAKDNKVDLTIFGPEVPLIKGGADYFLSRGLLALGPTSRGAMLEGSKILAKQFMTQAKIPTAPFIAAWYEEALAHVRTRSMPCVVKADGVAGGKGSIPCDTLAEAEAALNDILMRKKFGKVGDQVVIEDFVPGPEISAHALLCQFGEPQILPFFRDHKRLLDGDKGPNTGGMGVVGPIDVSPSHLQQITNTILKTDAQLKANGVVYNGPIYPGFKGEEELKLLEYNCRFGDPECQGKMRLLRGPVLPTLMECAQGFVGPELKWRNKYVAVIVLAAAGYPDNPQKGAVITGIEEAQKIPGVVVFHAGTKRLPNGTFIVDGGRVLNVTATGMRLKEAIDMAYLAVSHIYFEGMQFRRDIGASSL